MLKAIPGLKVVQIPFTSGVNESAAVNTTPPEQSLLMNNWRLSKDGTRIEKRLGSNEQANGFNEDVYGYTSYWDANNNYCQIAILESQIKRKVGNANWASIHTWANNLAHPVVPIEIQGKILMIWENDSRMVHYDGNDYQIGITAPSTIATVTANWNAGDTRPLTDNFNYNGNNADFDANWTDADSPNNNGKSLPVTSGPATTGPGNDNNYAKFYFNGNLGGSNYIAKRTKDLSSTSIGVGTSFTVTIPVYLDEIGGDGVHKAFHVKLYNGVFLTHLIWDKSGIYVDDTDGKKTLYGTAPVQNRWKTYKFIIDGTDTSAPTIQGYINDVSMGKAVEFSYVDTTTESAQIYAEGYSNTNIPTVYVDSIDVTSSGGVGGVLEGTYRYAITYARSGNYSCESNPIKSVIGTPVFTGNANSNNNMTANGSFSGNETKEFKILINNNAGTEKVSWSDDAGESWRANNVNISNNMYLSYGVQISFGAITGHNNGDYWSFNCTPMTATAAKQVIELTNIPTSSDPQVKQRKIYRSTRDGANFYWLATIDDNTTTTFIDNIPDSLLGQAMDEDKDVLPNGKFSCWWDNRLWVSGSNVVYYSEIDIPEQFDTDERFILVRSGLIGDEIIGMIEYRDSLYVFKRRSTFVITANIDGTYSCKQTQKDFGFSSGWSILEVQGLLMGYNDRGIDIFNGINNDVTFGTQVERTMSGVDETKLDFITSAHNPTYNEVWFSFPDSSIIVVYNYISNAWYTFSFPKAISCLSECRDSSKNFVLRMGTRDGYIYTCDSGYTDGGTVISADLFKPWLTIPEYGDIRRIELECEIPGDNTLTVDSYVNFEKDLKRTEVLYGSTPDTTLQDLRRVLFRKIELGQRGKYVAFRFRNAETMTGHLKLNNMFIYYHPRAMKEDISGD